jgi:hypothetical protein
MSIRAPCQSTEDSAFFACENPDIVFRTATATARSVRCHVAANDEEEYPSIS